ncbi:FMN-binding protein [Peptoniphilus sp. KCTC 25270]|uniref:FMN-binding protein n=1 Tax=Peptoniphilus sp. KCTC 25270 TaxID=2897414 RepID=UPI001E3FC03E|nr:FMN-binding protein [Peptoniphilus sp. KCTC 25270]MCD1146706.1 FMN-binding protein [Peptoniphilus sp. KCTC 25270]
MKKSKVIVAIALCGTLFCACTSKESYSANSIKTENNTIYLGNEASGRRLLKDGEYTAEGEGLQGPIKVRMRVRDGFIDRIEVVEHSENSGVVEEAFSSLSRTMIKKQSAEVDTVSGATEASMGVIDAVRKCMRQAGVEA